MKKQSATEECPEKWSEREDATGETKMKGTKRDILRIRKGKGKRRKGGGGRRERKEKMWKSRRD